jgi:hypothetical protein
MILYIRKIKRKEVVKMTMTTRERLFDIAVEIEEITNKEHLTVEDMAKISALTQESAKLQKEMLERRTRTLKAIYGI